MALHEVKTSHSGGMHFESNVAGWPVAMDAAEEVGGKGLGARPKQLLLAALAGCTGMDVVSLLDKMRVSYSEFDIDIEADLSEEHPKVYTRIHIKYLINVSESGKEKVEKAVNLSQDKYCGVSAMLKMVCPVTWEISYR